jgi:hypothetical protein
MQGYQQSCGGVSCHQKATSLGLGSAANGLGFFHIEIPDVVVNPVATTKNCGLVLIEEGNITNAELAK